MQRLLYCGIAAWLAASWLVPPALLGAEPSQEPSVAPPPDGGPTRTVSEDPSDIDAVHAPWRGRTVRSVDLDGNKVTRPDVILRELHTKVGEPLDLETLHEDCLRLENLQVFSSIVVEAAPVAADGV